MTDHDEHLRDAAALLTELQGEASVNRSARIKAGMRRREQERLPLARAALDAARQAGHGPDTPPGDRGAVIFRLQQQGCRLAEIAELFGICYEYAGRQVSEYRKSQGIPRGTPTRLAGR